MIGKTVRLVGLLALADHLDALGEAVPMGVSLVTDRLGGQKVGRGGLGDRLHRSETDDSDRDARGGQRMESAQRPTPSPSPAMSG